MFLFESDGLHALGGAGTNAGTAAGTLVGVHQSQIAFHGDRTLGADLGTLAAADTTGLAGLHDGLAELGVGTAVDDLLMLGDHVDHVLGAGLFAQTAANTQFLVDAGDAVLNGDRILGTCSSTSTAAGTTADHLIAQMDDFCFHALICKDFRHLIQGECRVAVRLWTAVYQQNFHNIPPVVKIRPRCRGRINFSLDDAMCKD